LPGKPRGDAESIFLARPDSQVSIARFQNLVAKEIAPSQLRPRRSSLRRNRRGFSLIALLAPVSVRNAVGLESNKFAWDACSILITRKSPQ
jgi:hypothetical protein